MALYSCTGTGAVPVNVVILALRDLVGMLGLPLLINFAVSPISALVHLPLASSRASLTSSCERGRVYLGVPSPRILTEENAIAVLDECQEELATVFGSNADSQRVGITGALEFVELDGPIIVVRLKGRFWHQRAVVVDRITSYVMERIPECVDVEIEDASQLDDSEPDELEKKLSSTFDDTPVQFGNN